MQKKIIALAVAGLMSGAAFAQSNVTIYGVIDQYYANGSADNAGALREDKFSGINSGGLSGSRIGFKGTEELGNGLKSVFVLEYGTLDTTSGSANNNGMDNFRQAYAGLTGGFGTVVAGRLQHLGYNWATKYDSNGASIFSPIGQLSDNAGLLNTGRGGNARVDNAVAYISPNLNGFTLGAAYAFGEQVEDSGTTVGGLPATDTVKDTQAIYQFAADYDNGPLSVGGVYTKATDVGGTLYGANGTDVTDWGIGIKYDFGMVTPFFMYQDVEVDAPVAAGDTDVKLWQIGARAPIGAAWNLGLSYGEIEVDPAAATSDNADIWSLDVQYSLSKRTTLYAGYSSLSNDNGLAFEFKNLRGSSGRSVAASNGSDGDMLAIGMRHTF
jgi:predicted porin